MPKIWKCPLGLVIIIIINTFFFCSPTQLLIFDTKKIKIWMCGGTLELHPCSRVGHVFRKTTPYKFPLGSSETINHNINRLAQVWLDEFADLFYKANPGKIN